MSKETTRRYEIPPGVAEMIVIWTNYLAMSMFLLIGAKTAFSQTGFMISAGIIVGPFFVFFFLLHRGTLKKFGYLSKSSESSPPLLENVKPGIQINVAPDVSKCETAEPVPASNAYAQRTMKP